MGGVQYIVIIIVYIISQVYGPAPSNACGSEEDMAEANIWTHFLFYKIKFLFVLNLNFKQVRFTHRWLGLVMIEFANSANSLLVPERKVISDNKIKSFREHYCKFRIFFYHSFLPVANSWLQLMWSQFIVSHFMIWIPVKIWSKSNAKYIYSLVAHPVP